MVASLKTQTVGKLTLRTGTISQFIAHRGSRLGLAVNAKAGGLLTPNAGIEVATSQIPERRPFMLTQVSQARVRVSHRLTKCKDNNVEYPRFTAGKLSPSRGQSATITLRGNDFPSCFLFSLTKVSHARVIRR